MLRWMAHPNQWVQSTSKHQWSICLSVKLGYCTPFFWFIKGFSTWGHQIGPRVRSCMIHLSRESEGRKKWSWHVLTMKKVFLMGSEYCNAFLGQWFFWKIMENREILGLGFLAFRQSSLNFLLALRISWDPLGSCCHYPMRNETLVTHANTNATTQDDHHCIWVVALPVNHLRKCQATRGSEGARAALSSWG